MSAVRFNSFPDKPGCLLACSKGLLKALWEKEKLLVTSNFSISQSIFYPFGDLSAIFIKFEIVVCKALSVWKSLKFVVWERVKLSFQSFRWLALYHTIPTFNDPKKRRIRKTPFEKRWKRTKC